jgi:hypothetical protein
MGVWWQLPGSVFWALNRELNLPELDCGNPSFTKVTICSHIIVILFSGQNIDHCYKGLRMCLYLGEHFISHRCVTSVIIYGYMANVMYQ